MAKRAAPDGDLTTYAREAFEWGGAARDVYRKGVGPAVLVLAEMPGITPQVLGFADRVAALGLTAVLPTLFGTPGYDPRVGSAVAKAVRGLGVVGEVCVSRAFTMFVTGRSSPVIDWLRALAEHEHARAGGPGVGVVGMCFTGGFALSMAVDPRVLAPVLSQPSLPVSLSARARSSIDCAEADVAAVAGRCAREGLRVLGLRFDGDPLVPAERFRYLKERLGDGFVAVELRQADGHPDELLKKHHSVLTGGLIDEPGEPTRAALDRVLALLKETLLPAPAAEAP